MLTVQGNQPTLRAKLKDLPWSQVPGHTYRDNGHGRRVTRTVKAALRVPVLDDDPKIIPAQPLDAGDNELVFQAEQHCRTVDHARGPLC